MARFRVESHRNDILEKDIPQGKTKEDYYNFYITNIDFVKGGFNGVEVFTSVMPDNYDFASWNGVDLSDTTESNPGKITVYYGEDAIYLNSMMPSEISEITLLIMVPFQVMPLKSIINQEK